MADYRNRRADFHQRRAHQRTERVTLQRLRVSANQTAHGEVDRSDAANWENIGTRWASVVPKGSAEVGIGDQQIATATTEFEFGADSLTLGILPTDRLLHRGLVYDIDPIRNLSMRNDVVIVTGVLIQ